MNAATYNASLLAGLLMLGAGVAMISVPLALAATGGLVILLTMFSASLWARASGQGG